LQYCRYSNHNEHFFSKNGKRKKRERIERVKEKERQTCSQTNRYQTKTETAKEKERGKKKILSE